MSIRSLSTTLLLPLWFAACASPGMRQVMDRQEAAVRSGDERALDTLYQKRKEVPESQKERYVTLIGEGSTEKSSDMLHSLYNDPAYRQQQGPILETLSHRTDEGNANFIRSRLDENPSLYNDRMEAFLIQRGDRQSAETVLRAIEKGQARPNPRSITFFGKVQLSTALPALEAHANQGNDVGAVMDAVARFGTPEAVDYLLQSAKNPDHPGRIAAIRRLSSVPDQSTARNYLQSLLRPSAAAAELNAAIESLREMGYNEESYNLIKKVYYETEDTAVRSTALESMATLRQVDSTELAKELEGQRRKEQEDVERTAKEEKARKESIPTTPTSPRTRKSLTKAYERDSGLTDIIKNHRPRGEAEEEAERTRKAHRTPRALYRLDESEAASRRYERRISNSLTRILGDEAPSVRLKIHNALLSYADSGSGSGQFIHRAYARGFRVEDNRVKDLLRKGLHLPNALETVLSAVVSEYGRRDLQVYALSSFFAIKRKQAEKMLDAYRRRSF